MATDSKEQLRQAAFWVAGRFGVRAEALLRSHPDALDQFLDAIVGAIQTEVRGAVGGVALQADEPLGDLVRHLDARLDRDNISAEVAALLAERLRSWFETNSEAKAALSAAVADRLMARLDLEEFAHEIADQVSERVAGKVSVQVQRP